MKSQCILFSYYKKKKIFLCIKKTSMILKNLKKKLIFNNKIVLIVYDINCIQNVVYSVITIERSILIILKKDRNCC